MKSKFKADWFEPIIPAMCVFQAVNLIAYSTKHTENTAALVIGLLGSLILFYATFFYVTNALRRYKSQQ